MDIFGYKKLTKYLEGVVHQNNNIIYLMKTLAKEFGIQIEIMDTETDIRVAYVMQAKNNTVNLSENFKK